MKKKKRETIKSLKAQLKRTRWKIKKLEKALGEHTPTFIGYGKEVDSAVTMTLNGSAKHVRWRFGGSD